MSQLYRVETKPYSLLCPYKQRSWITDKNVLDLKKYDLSVMSPPISISFEKCNLVSPKLSSHKKTTKKSLMHQDGAWPWTICCFRAAKPWLSVKDRDCEQQTIFMTAQRIPNCGEHGHSVCDMSRPVLVKIPSLWKFPAFWKWYTSLWVLGLMRNPRKSW